MTSNKKPSSGGVGFLRAISVLVGGTAAAHAVTALAMPLLSRLYGPAEFGGLAVFMGIVTTVSVAACLRFDVAVALPESDDDGMTLLVLSLIAALGVALMASLVVVLIFDQLSGWIKEPALHQGKWLIPAGIFGAAAWSALQNWQIRKHNFGLMAQARFAQSTVTAGTQAGAAFAGVGSLGLLLGPTLAFFASSALFLRRGWREFGNWFCRRRIAEMRRVAHEYRRFPIYSTWEALFNQAAIHLPIIMIAAVATAAEAGYLMLAMYVLQAPMGLLGAAIGQAYLSRAPQALRDGRIVEFTDEVLANLIKTGAGPIVAVGILSPVIFPLLFGTAWDRAGWLVTWMTPWFLFQFLASPVSMVLHVLGAQRAAMQLQLFSLLVRLGVTWLAVQVLPERVAESYALSGAVVYLGYFAVIQAHLGSTGENARGVALFAAARWVVPWVFGSLMVALGIAHMMSRLAY